MSAALAPGGAARAGGRVGSAGAGKKKVRPEVVEEEVYEEDFESDDAASTGGGGGGDAAAGGSGAKHKEERGLPRSRSALQELLEDSGLGERPQRPLSASASESSGRSSARRSLKLDTGADAGIDADGERESAGRGEGGLSDVPAEIRVEDAEGGCESVAVRAAEGGARPRRAKPKLALVDNDANLEESFRISNDGVLHTKNGFAIKKSGIVVSPDRAEDAQAQTQAQAQAQAPQRQLLTSTFSGARSSALHISNTRSPTGKVPTPSLSPASGGLSPAVPLARGRGAADDLAAAEAARGGASRPPASPQGSGGSVGGGAGSVDQVGATLGDLSPEKFLVLETLGQGAEGVVRKALYLPRNKLVALKTVDFFQRDRRQQVVKELDTFHKLRHPNVVECFGASFAEGSLTLVFEYMNRGSLQKAVKDYGPFGEEELRVIFAQVLQGLVHIHDLKQIHRDIKPDNVLINHRGEAKIGDFGILGRLKTEQEMLTTFVGTAVFMSPERIKVKSYTYAADIWSLGLTIFFCATGAMPFSSAKGGYWGLINEICEGEPPKLPPSFSPELRSLVDVCLQKDPARRWTAARLLEHPFFLRMPAAAGSAAAESTPASPPRTAAIDWSRSAASAAVIASELKREGAELIAERGGWALEARRRLRATEEIEALADALVREQYLKPGVEYKRSLFEQSKFAMLAAELGCSFEDVIGAFERRYEVLSRSRA